MSPCQGAKLMRPFFCLADTGPVNIYDLVVNASFVCSGQGPSGTGRTVLSSPLPERTAARRLAGASSQHVFLHFSTLDRRENRFPLLVPPWRLGYSQRNTRGFKVDAFTQYLDIFSRHPQKKKPSGKLREAWRKTGASKFNKVSLDIWIGEKQATLLTAIQFLTGVKNG